MNNLYTDLSAVYEAMYHSFINYKDEADFYTRILQKNECRDVVEIGCGTGNLSPYFHANKIEYMGVDMSNDMLQMAKKKFPDTKFIKADMRNFSLKQKTQNCIITGRTLSYLISNADIISSFKSINKILTTKGILCFDFIDALRFIPTIVQKKNIEHRAAYNSVKYLRKSQWHADPSQNWLFKWRSVFYEEQQQGKLKKLGEDNSLLRSFSRDEVELFLDISGFRVIKFIDRPSYAFDTFVTVAEKK